MTPEEEIEMHCAKHAAPFVLREKLKATLQKAVTAERERCAKVSERMKLTGGSLSGETPGPLFDAGWDSCAEETAKMIRQSSEKGKA